MISPLSHCDLLLRWWPCKNEEWMSLHILGRAGSCWVLQISRGLVLIHIFLHLKISDRYTRELMWEVWGKDIDWLLHISIPFGAYYLHGGHAVLCFFWASLPDLQAKVPWLSVKVCFYSVFIKAKDGHLIFGSCKVSQNSSSITPSCCASCVQVISDCLLTVHPKHTGYIFISMILYSQECPYMHSISFHNPTPTVRFSWKSTFFSDDFYWHCLIYNIC